MIIRRILDQKMRGLVGLIFLSIGGSTVASCAEPPDWKKDYSVDDGFRIQRDSVGYHLPTAIAFVPEPGPGPKDALYFVTELRGTLKVVTNDRTVLVFAEGFQNLTPHKELPDHLGETGMAGICLEPEHGYIFVSYAYEDKSGMLRNAIMRFETKPKVFAAKPTGQKLLAPVLDSFTTYVAHQIGPMAIMDGNLFVNIGDGYSPGDCRDINFPNGKVLRMTLDGLPLADNPFAIDRNPQRVRNYVWALGFRNPFSLCAVNGRLFVADNGFDTDRFVELKRGADYLYVGEPESGGANALYVWVPAVSPVQMAYDVTGDGTADFPEPWKKKFFVALSGAPTDAPGPDLRRKCVASLAVDFPNSRLLEIPRQLMRYVGSKSQLIVGVAMGHDGLYVVNMFPDAEGATAILHIDYKPEAAHPRQIFKNDTAEQIMDAKQCFSCHKIDGRGTGSVGPMLSRLSLVEKILDRIESPEYQNQIKAIDALTTEPFIQYRKARAEMRAAEGTEKARLWIKYRVLEPRFDRTLVAMPNLGLTEKQAELVSAWFVEPSSSDRLKLQMSTTFGGNNKKNLVILGFALGGFAGVIGTVLVAVWFWRRRQSV